MDDLLQQGVTAYKAGKRDEARKIFITVVKQKPESERAWGWMYDTSENDKERIYCLKQMLRINPNNDKANQLLHSLLNQRSQLETSHQVPTRKCPYCAEEIQPEAIVCRYCGSDLTPQKPNQPQIPVQPVKKQPVTKSNQSLLILIFIGVLVSIFICVCGFFVLPQFLNPSKETTAPPVLSKETTALPVLSAEDVFEVSAINVVKTNGYTVTSAVCEVVSSERYLPSVDIDGGQIVFHAFRITKPSLGSEVVVLFYSNHTAAQGNGLVFPVNPEAIRLFPEFPDATLNSKYPITVDTAGAQEALECAQQAGSPPTLNFGNFDVEAWRRKTIEKFGKEQAYDDGSKDDYVRLALSICKYKKDNPNMMYDEGSLQQYILDTFCPYVDKN